MTTTSPSLRTTVHTSPLPLTRVGLIEDDPIQAAEMTRLLLADSRLLLEGTWASAEAAVQPLAQLTLDIVLVDIGLPGQSGIELVRTLAPCLPATQFMMLTVYDDPDRLFDALSAGAAGYLLKKTAPTRLLEAIQELRDGGSPMSAAIARHVVKRFQQPVPRWDLPSATNAHLTPREQEILDLLAQGRLYKEIAETLGIGLGTVRTHIRRIYEKLHARNRTEAVRLRAVF